MEHNPYAPPDAQVRDPMDPHRARPRPARVALAVRLLWIELAVTVIQVACTWVIAQDPLFRAIVLGSAMVTLPLEALVIYQISRGRNWARWVTLVVVMVSVLMWLGSLGGSSEDSTVSAILGGVELVLDAGALYLLFANPGRQWFLPPAQPDA